MTQDRAELLSKEGFKHMNRVTKTAAQRLQFQFKKKGYVTELIYDRLGASGFWEIWYKKHKRGRI